MAGLFRQVFAGMAGGLCLLIVGCWLGWPSPWLRKLQQGEANFNLTKEERSWVVALMDFGNVLSPIPTGYMMDACGRKPTFFATAVVFQVSWLLAVYANGPTLLYVARLLAGIGKGMGFTVVPMYLAEIAEVKVRGALSAIFTFLLFSGTLLELVIGPYVSYNTLNVISSTIPVLFCVLVVLIPESPYFLLMKNRRQAAYRSFCWLRNHYKGKQQAQSVGHDAVIETELEKMDAQVQKEMASRGDWSDLVGSRGTRRATLAVMSLCAMQRFGGISCMLAYTSTTLPETGGGPGLGPEAYMMIFGLVLVLANFICMPLIDWLGRKPLLIISTIVSTVVQAASAYFYYVRQVPDYDYSGLTWIPYAGLVLFAVAYSLGIGVVPNTLLGELFPANVKSKAAAVATIFFAIASFSVNKVYPSVPNYTMFAFFALTNFIATIFTWFFVIETKGKSFSEIQQLLNKQK
ncbi:facilitated trehalose transporter Tret1 [Nilaparvata lugens]|uniref:facilitated trehalose transporter Tret1 n=1 Tax=Nilaparvata lugens TaxID=108931 RepID=UPI00193C8B1D|nr:facilitated trehalose transporter Tret1 [Nilaparvata lugens]